MIVSIFLKEHEYLINSSQTLNFGGKYLYSFEEVHDKMIIKRTLNKKYIPNFFNISESECKVELLSAIVGENGVGKSSILDLIRSIFTENIHAYPNSIFVVLIEEKDETKVLYSNIRNDIYLDDKKLEFSDKSEYQSIYYSPHFDLKYNSNFDEIDKNDISLDKFIKLDLEDIYRKGTNENGWKYHLHDELKYKNTLRIIEFMNSEIFKKSEILEIFNLKAEYEEIDLIFRDIETNDVFHDTPIQFRNLIKKINDTIESEISKWHTLRKFDKKDRVANQIEINKYILKRFIIRSILSVIARILEEDAGNNYLYEGKIEEEEKFKDGNLDAEEMFLLFLQNTFVEKEGKRKIFDEKLFFDLFNEINKVIKPIDNADYITNQKIRVKVKNVGEIISLHRKCVRNLTKYFDWEKDKNLNLYEFISIDPYRSMSSGELALLNLFSRLYYFIDNKPYLFIKANIVILLDEADLGFHPIWKKKYINAILKALPHFFVKLNTETNLQIIITTHDPLTLSDIPNDNVIFLQKDGERCKAVDKKERISSTFGANITDLLAHSFFIENGLIGDFAKSKIEETITWINKNKSKKADNFEEELEYYKKIINLIDERVLKLKLTEMITELVPDDKYYIQVIDDEIKKLTKLKNNELYKY